MSGAPRSLYAPSHFVMISVESVRQLDGEWSTAACFRQIAWRCERDHLWRASMKTIAEEIAVSERTVKRLTTKLREKGWITAERENAWEPTLTWRVVWEDESSESANVALSGGDDKTAGQTREGQVGTHESDNPGTHESDNPGPPVSDNLAPSQGDNLALTSLETIETKNETNNVSEADASTRRDLNEGREDVDRLVEHLSKRLTERDVRHSITKAWRDAARLLIDTDGRSEAQVHNMIEWCQDSEFWRANIHSMPKLRERYDQMREQALRGHSGNVHPISTRHHSTNPDDRQAILNSFG